jgi:hypothetical protein
MLELPGHANKLRERYGLEMPNTVENRGKC